MILKLQDLKKQKKEVLLQMQEFLRILHLKGHNFPQLVLDWRQVSKLKNTYSDSLPEHINPNTKEFTLLFY